MNFSETKVSMKILVLIKKIGEIKNLAEVYPILKFTYVDLNLE